MFGPSSGVNVVVIVLGVPAGVGLQTGIDNFTDRLRVPDLNSFAVRISSAGTENRAAILSIVSFSFTS